MFRQIHQARQGLINVCIGIARAIFDGSEAGAHAHNLPRKPQNLCEKLTAIEQLSKSARFSCKEITVAKDAGKSARRTLRQSRTDFYRWVLFHWGVGFAIDMLSCLSSGLFPEF
jgi:hypothetical protein